MAALVLRRIGRLGAQLLGRVPRPARVEQHDPPQRDQVGLAAAHDGLSLPRVGDLADGDGGQAALPLHFGREADLVAGPGVDLLIPRSVDNDP